MSKPYIPLVLFNDYAPSILPNSTSASLSSASATSKNNIHDQRENLSRSDADPSLPRSHSGQQQPQQPQRPRGETDMDVDMDMDMDNPKSSQSTNNVSKASTLSPLNVSIANKNHYRSMSSSSSTDSPTSLHGMVSPPSSYSSSSSNMEHLAKTLSPARIDIHRNKVQRMLQQNSLLWWELVRYTRNLERKEKEQEIEKEQIVLPSSPSPSRSKAVEHYHHHHHHHHHHASLPPLHPHQSMTSKLPSIKDKDDEPRSYEYQEHSQQERTEYAYSSEKPVPEDSYPRQAFVARPARASPPIQDREVREVRDGQSRYSEDQITRYRHQQPYPGAYRGRSPGSRSPSPVRRPLEPTLGHRSSNSSLRQSPTHYSMDRPEGPYSNYQPQLARPHPTYPRYQGSQNQHYEHPSHRPLAPEEHPYSVLPQHSRQGTGPRADPAHQPPSIPTIKRSPMESGPYSLLPSPLTPSRNSSGPSSTESSPRPTQAPPHHQHPHYPPRPQPAHYPSQHPRTNSHPYPPRHDSSSSSPHSNSLGSSYQKIEPTGRPTMEAPSRPHAPSGPISVSGGSNTMSSVETEPSSSSIPGGDAQSNMDPNRKRRGNLPKSVTSVLKNWLVQNAIHPYPTEDEKIKLAEATHLSLNQISNWFINARRRILQPILVEAAAAAVAGTDAPMENVLIVRKGKGSRMQVEMEASTLSNSGSVAPPTSSSITTSTSHTSMPQHPPHRLSASPVEEQG
ncbi:hypothetical protein CPB97_009169 [Podila verticillata]|nr:hypothetical protein CPB97_009169 [Podila verticillata]